MILLLLLLQVSDVTRTPSTSSQPLQIVRKLSDVTLSPSLLGGDWKTFPGLVVDDLKNINSVESLPRKIAEDLKQQLIPNGVVSFASISLARKNFPPDAVTVEIFVFASEDKCNVWWQKKYQSAGWEKIYRVVKDARFATLDTLDNGEFPNNKRIVKFGENVVISGHMRKSDEHLKALENVIEQLTTRKK
jgi:hypothetical protein